MIASAGGFAGIDANEIAELWFWRLKGGTDGGEQRSAGSDIGLLIEQAYEGLAELVRRFDDPATPYQARPHPGHAPKYSDYGHLARLGEWGEFGEGEE